MMLDLGFYREKRVTTNDENLKNRHVAVIGKSGSGKTVQCQRLICSAIEQGHTVIAFDLHGTLADDQIFWKYKACFKKYIHEIDVYTNGILCDLFVPLTYPDGTKEHLIDTIGGLTDVIAKTVNAGCVQRAELRKALMYVAETGRYAEIGFKAVDEALHLAGNKTAEAMREKLYTLTAHNVFRSGDELFAEGQINIFRLSKFDLQTQILLAELILTYLWRLANMGKFKAVPIYIFIDEFQNLPSAKGNALAQMLSEGRKFGVNLILASQMVLQGTISAVQQRITQCGLMLYFQPAANRISATARMIEESAESDWSRILRSLGIGEFIASGSFIVGGKERNGALKVTAYEK